jgi:hypothetical protein
VNHRAHVANFEAFNRHGLGQNDSIVLFDHFKCSPVARIRGHEPRRIPAAIDDPNRPDRPLAALLSVRGQPATDNVFLSMRRFSAFHDFAMFGDFPEHSHQALGILMGEAERREEPRLSTLSGCPSF